MQRGVENHFVVGKYTIMLGLSPGRSTNYVQNKRTLKSLYKEFTVIIILNRGQHLKESEAYMLATDFDPKMERCIVITPSIRESLQPQLNDLILHSLKYRIIGIS
jgi:hypothetical protein